LGEYLFVQIVAVANADEGIMTRAIPSKKESMFAT
jgi:hypothetical protein